MHNWAESTPMNLRSDDFALFDLPCRFAQDSDVIQARWKQLQKQTHPDRFASEGAAAQRLAMQWSVRINEAYQRLKNPLARAAYLCELHDIPIAAEDNTAMPAAFLMQQMEWREALADAETEAALAALARQTQAAHTAALENLQTLIDEQQDWRGAANQVRVLMFITRFARDISTRRTLLEQ